MALPDGYEHKNAQKCFEQAIKGSICIWAPTVVLPAIMNTVMVAMSAFHATFSTFSDLAHSGGNRNNEGFDF